MNGIGKFIGALLLLVFFTILITAGVALCASLVNELTFGEQLGQWFGSETFFVKWFTK